MGRFSAGGWRYEFMILKHGDAEGGMIALYNCTSSDWDPIKVNEHVHFRFSG